jgi:hypothetical protein
MDAEALAPHSRRRGRKKQFDGVLPVNLTGAQRRRLKARAGAERRPMADVVRAAIDHYLADEARDKEVMSA